jgi:3D (Asp-Asp-Asp) domain-containing protein
MTIAVDPRVIPMGSKALIMFDDKVLKQYNGVYTARDVGGLVKGKHIDIFMGDFRSNSESKVTRGFGVQRARVVILSRGSIHRR